MTKADLPEKLAASRQIAAIATAFFLPFSTSGQAIGVSVFAVLALLTLDRARFLATIRRPASSLPVALFALILVGVLWSMLPLNGAIKWVGPYAKLLLIPLLLATAFTEKQALHIGYGFLASCLVILALSYAYLLWPTGPWSWFKSIGVPFKDNAVQSECFAICALGLALGARRVWTDGDRRRAIALGLLALLFFADIFLIYVSKTGMLVAFTMVAILVITIGGWRTAFIVGLPIIAIVAATLAMSPGAKSRFNEMATDVTAGTETKNVSTASRIDFWSKASEFVKQAPLLGHGTGSIRPLYQSLEATRPSPYGEAVADPHNQFLHTTLQVGLIGGAILLAMWAAHFWLLRGRDFASAMGLGIFAMTVVGSLFNSHISQVTQGMLYCLGVGLLGAVVLHRGAVAPPPQPDHHDAA
ncbi:O-antigen ligase family protein [Tardiphaga sp.]|jgi:O-antigen ligase|uniref:O-antigen ligase family protein n=1 Tax=Tardiphaga sp. TaxID=1926292 RepID=UPI0037D9C2AA